MLKKFIIVPSIYIVRLGSALDFLFLMTRTDPWYFQKGVALRLKGKKGTFCQCLNTKKEKAGIKFNP